MVDDFHIDEKEFLKKVKKIEDSGESGKVEFMGKTMIYKKNPWKGQIFPKKSERIWARLPDPGVRKPTEYQEFVWNLSKKVGEHPGMKSKNAAQRNAIRKNVKEELLRMDEKDITRESVDALIDRCVRAC